MNDENIFNNYYDQKTINLVFDAIEKHLENKDFVSALMLALTIPDALGKLKYPNRGVAYRYINWFNENVRNNMGLLPLDTFYEDWQSPMMKGKVCYHLRCHLLHELNNDIKAETGIDDFVLSLEDSDFVMGNYAGSEMIWEKYDPKTKTVPQINYLYVSCKGLCKSILFAGKEFVRNNPNLKYPTIKINNGGGRFNKDLFIKT